MEIKKFNRTTILVDPEELKDTQMNRQLDRLNLKKLQESIQEVGQKHAIQINEFGEIINGHHRVKVCSLLGIAVKAYVDDNEPEEIREYNHEKSWMLKDWLFTGKNRAVLNLMQKHGIPMNTIELILDVKSVHLKNDQVIAEENDTFVDLLNFIEDIYEPIKEGLETLSSPTGKRIKANRFFYKCIAKISRVAGINIDRLIDKTLENAYDINIKGQEHEILKSIVSHYNKNLNHANKLTVLDDNTIQFSILQRD
jgi:ParB-like nuclease domain